MPIELYRWPNTAQDRHFRNRTNDNWEKLEGTHNEIEKVSEQAKEDASIAKDKALEANDLSNSVQTQLDTIVVSGDSGPEAKQARIDTKGIAHPTLKARADSDFKENASQITENIKEINNLTGRLLDTITISPSGKNDTFAWNKAIDNIANGGKIELTHGDYFIDSGKLKSNITIRARGRVRILSDTYVFSVNSGSPDTANNISNITFEYINFEAITKIFSQWVHLVNLNGVSDIIFKRCAFVGFRGDGVYLGSGDAGEERHNENIHFEKCIFDGVNKQNRNGISIIDGDGVYIERCQFRNCTQPNMPGAIDIEPNSYVWAVIRNIHIRQNKFENIGGNTGVIGMYLPLSQNQLTTPAENIVIEGNIINKTTDTQGGFSFIQSQFSIIDNMSIGLNIKVINNRAKNLAGGPFAINGIKNASIMKNEFQGTAKSASVGYKGINDKCVHIKLKENTFKNCGLSDGKGVTIFAVDRVDVLSNTFDDCGNPNTASGYGIDFHNGISSNVRIIGNDFVSPSGIMNVAIQKEDGHTFTLSGNIDQQNNYNGLKNFFVALLKNPYLSTEGVETINPGFTSVVVTHKLPVQPTRVFVTIQGFYGNVGSPWVDTITPTQFTIRIPNPPAGVIFASWKASQG
ncbi:right-handed parallel beta-helix repeat-containing protein [Bacillus thuringiensis]|uniref:right-handed parallel beta-helix repeat-containing protein n=1 Tax=Bacillus thuringiensis TaxID=1428 RepID=UPI0011427FD9|nr:right-handed parallel beta-helix repeat-containing protein [Bacillus thuringiensis]